jgi:hypothetical protein
MYKKCFVSGTPLDADSIGSEDRIWIQVGKNHLQKKEMRKCHILIAECSLWKAGWFSWSLEFLHGLRI